MAQIKLRYVNAFADRNGLVLYYFRRRGCKAIPLPGAFGSEDFMAAYASALTTIPDRPSEIGASRTEAGTINALVVTYYKSAAWENLRPDSQTTFRPVIEKFRIRHGNKRVALLRREHIGHILDQINKPSAKDKWLKAIRMIMGCAIPSLRNDDPTAGITISLPRSKGHHCWTDDEIEQYRAHWPLGTQQRLVMEFALETTSRRSEVVRLGPQHVKHGRIRIERCHGSRDVNIPMTVELKAACDAMPKAHLTYIVTKQGKPRSPHGLAKDFVKWARAAGLPDCCRLHGLKKGGMRRLAESGATTKEMMGVSGHKTLAMVQLYSDEADQIGLADSAMAKLEARSSNREHGYTNTGDQITQTAAKPLKNLR